MTKLIQPSMAGGEISPPVGARVDLSKRAVSVELAENFYASFTGGMHSRPGQKFVAQTKVVAASLALPRIIEFEFNDTQTFVIEMGHQYLRFHSLGAQILDSSKIQVISGATAANPVVITATAHPFFDGDEVYIDGVAGMTELNGRSFKITSVLANSFALVTLGGDLVDGTGYTAYTSGGTATPPYEITSPWVAADLLKVGYGQSGDVMTLVHPDYAAQELVRINNDLWTLTALNLTPVQAEPTNIDHTESTTVTLKTITNITQANPAVISAASHSLNVGDEVHIFDVAGMVEIDNFAYVVSATPTAGTFEVTYEDGTVVDSTGFTAYTSGGTAELLVRPRYYAVTAVSAATGEESLRGLDGHTVTNVTAITKANPAVVTVDEGHDFEDLDHMVLIGIVGMTELNGVHLRARFVSATTFSLETLEGEAIDSTNFTAWSSGGTAHSLFTRSYSSAETDWDNKITWTAAAGASNYNIYATDTFGVFGFIGTTSGVSFVDNNLGPDYSVTPPLFRNPFLDLEGVGDKDPAATGFFQQRRIFANSNTFPNRFWMSQLGHFDNFTSSRPAVTSDAITASIAARRINEIKHIVPLTDLLFLTSGGEYRVTGGEDGVLTPATISVSPQSYYGSTDVRPIVAGDVGLFISPGEFVRDLGFQNDSNKFIGKDVTLLARHLFGGFTIRDWDFAPSPSALGFVVMEDGAGRFLTYQPDQDVYAWGRASTKGKYKSTCVVREGQYDVIYVVVERTINGSTVSFIERLDERQFDVLSDAFCVDAGLTLDAPITITGATAANPVVVTTEVAHGLSNGDFVDLSDIKEVSTATNEGEILSVDYNGTGFEVTNVTATTFELQNAAVDYDGSGFAAYSSGGKARQAVTTVSGLWHLEGETVVAAANGYTEKGLVVTGGAVTLANKASRIHIGIDYFCRLITLPLSTYGDGKETSQGKVKNISRLTVQVERSMGMWHGPTLDAMREATFGLPALYGQPLEMVTEDVDVTMKGDWAKRKQVVIEQRDPLPLTVLTLIPDGKIGGN